MRVTLSITKQDADEQDILSLDIFPDMTIDTLRSSVHAEKGIDPRQQHLYHNGKLITESSKTMEQLHITDGDMLALHVRPVRVNAAAGPSSGRRPQQPTTQTRPPSLANDPEVIRLSMLADPRTRAALGAKNPRLVALIEDPEAFARQYYEELDTERRQRVERQRAINALNDDPFNVDAQRKIEEMIREERVMENLQNAIEHTPEVFGRVHLLYCDVQVNGNKVKALVDSGAQTTIMSPSCAEACGIMRLVDTRFAGIARGVGTANIIGRVHTAPIKIGTLHLPCSFTVMEGKAVDLLFGLDMLKRYQACIDLAKNKLIIHGEEIEFLGEADIPKELGDIIAEEPTINGPGGATIGARSGTVVADPGPSNTRDDSGPDAAQPAAQPEPAPAHPQSSAQSSAHSYPQEDIDMLVNLGFSREKAIEALTTADGNVEYAANYLYQQ